MFPSSTVRTLVWKGLFGMLVSVCWETFLISTSTALPKMASPQTDFNALCQKYEITRTYDWLGSVTEWKLLEGALAEKNVSKFDLADFNVLWSTHPARKQCAVAGAGILSFGDPAAFHVLKLKEEFPSAILNKNNKGNGSIHASSIISNSDNDMRETLMDWFKRNIANTQHFDLIKPQADERQAMGSRDFWSFKSQIEQLNLTVWDIQNTTSHTASLLLEDPTGRQKRLSGRADYVIASNQAHDSSAAIVYAKCIIEKQSRENEEDCEYQLVTYLVLLMKMYQFKTLSGILLYNDGRCRGYRASVVVDQGVVIGQMYEHNDTFDLYQIIEVLPNLLV